MQFQDNDGVIHNITTEVKKCPHCGEDPEIFSTGNSHTKKRSITIKCSAKWSCGNKGFVVGAIREGFEFCLDYALRRWNQRSD